MEEILSEIFKSNSIHRAAMIMNMSSQVIRAFENEFQKDGNAKNAAIDALIAVLNSCKIQAQ